MLPLSETNQTNSIKTRFLAFPETENINTSEVKREGPTRPNRQLYELDRRSSLL